MNGAITLHGLDFFIFGVPLIFFLIVAFFRLDNLLLPSKVSRPTRVVFRPFAERDPNSMFSDPDGRPWD